MAKITFKGSECNTCGTLPEKGTVAPDFVLTDGELADKKKGDFAGYRLILNVFPSVDTSVCATTVRRFNEEAAALSNTVVLCVSMDLPFAQERFCAADGIENVQTLSAFRSRGFGEDYGVRIVDGPLSGLFARALIGLDESGTVIYTQQVAEIAQEPDYREALDAVT